ncbi:MAG: RNA polymerase sigma factor, partial [Mesorhizobium sp.]
DKLATVFTDTFLFAGVRCDRLAQSVFDRLAIRLVRKDTHPLNTATERT